MNPEPVTPPAEVLIKRRIPFRRRLWVRISLAGLALSVMLFALWYWPRRTTIAVWWVNGTAFSNRVDQTTQQALTWANSANGGWTQRQYENLYRLLGGTLLLDAEVDHVALHESDVDDQWLSRLSRFPQLDSACLHDRQLGPALESLPGITTLSVKFASGDRLNELRRLPQLEMLCFSIAGSDDIDLAPLAALPNLRTLILDECTKTDVLLQRLPEMPHLERFTLQDCVGFTDDDLACLERLPGLTYFVLHRSGAVGDVGLSHIAKLPKLELINLFNSNGTITDAGIDSLLECRGLKELYIFPSLLTTEQSQRLQNGLPTTSVSVR